MQQIRRIAETVWACAVCALMPRAFARRDETLERKHRLPADRYAPACRPGPEENPFRNDPARVHERMRWDHQRGWADYS